MQPVDSSSPRTHKRDPRSLQRPSSRVVGESDQAGTPQPCPGSQVLHRIVIVDNDDIQVPTRRNRLGPEGSHEAQESRAQRHRKAVSHQHERQIRRAGQRPSHQPGQRPSLLHTVRSPQERAPKILLALPRRRHSPTSGAEQIRDPHQRVDVHLEIAGTEWIAPGGTGRPEAESLTGWRRGDDVAEDVKKVKILLCCFVFVS